MKKLAKSIVVGLLLTCFSITTANACSRVTYTTKTGEVVTGRTMDWEAEDAPTLYIDKRGLVRKSSVKTNPIEWVSKYGSVNITSKGNIANSGINEKGLAADVLWLEESNYGEIKDNEQGIGVSEYLQYMLDNFATVDEVVAFAKSSKIRPSSDMPQDFTKYTIKLHYIFTDKGGNNAIIEYINGEINVHQNKGRIVMTNDPSYVKMCAIRDYFREIGILTNMPGSSLSQARFVYLTGWLDGFTNKPLKGYIKNIENQSFENQAVMSVLSLMRGVSTPLGVEISAAEPNNTSTLWRTVTDVKNGKIYFDSALSPLTIWVDLNKVDFSKDYGHLDLSGGKVLFGDALELL